MATLKHQWVMLEVVYDHEESDEPANWGWDTLLDLNTAAGEFVVVKESGESLPWNPKYLPNPNLNTLAEPEPEPEPRLPDADELCQCTDCQLERGEYPCDACGDNIGTADANRVGRDFVCNDCYEENN